MSLHISTEQKPEVPKKKKKGHLVSKKQALSRNDVRKGCVRQAVLESAFVLIQRSSTQLILLNSCLAL